MAEPKDTKVFRKPPLSEDPNQFRPDFTRDDCIELLRKIAKENPDRIITRNFFRTHSGISESTWSRYFGTFTEFKRCAEITLSRHQHTLERQIAKHASKDAMRKLNEEKRSWEGTYLRPSDRRFQTVLVGSDIHDRQCDPFYRELFLEAAKRAQPEKIIIAGDLFDLTEFGHYTQDPRKYDPHGRILWVHRFLEDLRKAAPESEITLVEGNHEFRLVRHLSEATPALVTILDALHGMSISDILGLKKYEVNYVARMDLAVFNEADIRNELRKNYVIVYDALLFHHFPHAAKMGYPGANGHHHKHIVKHHYSPIFGPYEWHQLGCGQVRRQAWCEAEQWSLGFLLAHVDTHKKKTQFEYVDCTHDHAIMGGTFYRRK